MNPPFTCTRITARGSGHGRGKKLQLNKRQTADRARLRLSGLVTVANPPTPSRRVEDWLLSL